MRPENWSTTERDAERYERRYAPDYPDPLDDRPDPSDLWEPNLCGEVADEDYGDGPGDLEAGYVATALVLAFCIFGSLAFLLLLKYVGQPAMCKWSNDPRPAYCEQVAR